VLSMPAKGSEKRSSSVAERVALKYFASFRENSSSKTSSGSCLTSVASCQALPERLGNLLERGGGGGGSVAPLTFSSHAKRSKSSPGKTDWSPAQEELEENQFALFFEFWSLAQEELEENRLALSFEWPRVLPERGNPSLSAKLLVTLLQRLLARLLMTLLPRLLARLRLERLPLRACTSAGSVEAVAETGSQADLTLVLAQV